MHELWEDLGGRLPDVIVVPVGNGTLLLGAALAVAELHGAGLIDRRPALYAVQAAAVAPLAHAWAEGADDLVGVTPSAPTFAEGIAIRARPGPPDPARRTRLRWHVPHGDGGPDPPRPEGLGVTGSVRRVDGSGVLGGGTGGGARRTYGGGAVVRGGREDGTGPGVGAGPAVERHVPQGCRAPPSRPHDARQSYVLLLHDAAGEGAVGDVDRVRALLGGVAAAGVGVEEAGLVLEDVQQALVDAVGGEEAVRLDGEPGPSGGRGPRPGVPWWA